MADNVDITAGSGTTVHADEYVHGVLGSGKTQLVKLVDGVLDSDTAITVDIGAKANALRVVPASDITDATYIGDIKFGESLPAGTNEIGKLAAGSAAIGKLAANNGVDIGDVDVTSVIAGVGATNLGKARDSALGATDTGVMALAVRDDTLTTLTPADGDYVPLRVSSTGQLHVTGAGGGTEYTEDVATANPIVGSAVMMERDDIIAGLTPVEGDWAAMRCSAEGALWVQDFNSDAALALFGTIDADTGAIKIATELIDDAIYIDDADWSDNSSKHMLVGGVYQSSPHTVTDGDVSPFGVDVNGNIVLGTSAKAIGKLAANSGVDIGDVDVTSVPAPLNVVGGGTEAAALRVTIANNSTGLVSIDDGGGAITVDNGGTFAVQSTLQTGSAAIGKLATNSGVDIGDVDVTSIIPGVAATNLGKAEDAGHSSGDVGVAAMTVRANTATSLSGSDNDYQPLITDTNGRLHVLDANTANMLTALQIIDDWDAVHDSAASTDGPQLMAVYDATKPAAVADGDAVRVLADEYGRLLSGVEKTAWQEDYDSADASGEGEAVKASAASTILVVQSYIISVDAEMWVKLQEEDSSALTGKFWLKAGGGVSITLPANAPLVLGVDSDLEVITEGAGNISVSATGYTIPG